MSTIQMIIFVVCIVALSAGLLTWLAIDIGTAAMVRYRASFTERARFQVQEFFLFIDPKKLFILKLAIMAFGAALAWMLIGQALIAIPVFFALGYLPQVVYAWLRMRRRRKFEEQLPDALMMLSGGLRAGVGLSSAISQLVAEARAPLAQEFTLVLREQRLGVTLEQSLNHLNRRVPTQSTTLVVSAMRIAAETGGGLAETLERTSNTIRSRLQMEGKIRALTAQGKLQAWVVGLLPMALMAILSKMEPEAMSMLWHTRVGWGTLIVITFFEVIGVYVIRKIIAIDV
ncbi:MAG TPA: type II secretion system F family protein [Noviherbaspirillum sp.]|nr:type II secretion system F family protein [Noviherbaspirillum sp.]